MSMAEESDDPRLPDSLVGELRQAYRTDVRIAPEIDRLITSGARAHLAQRGRLRLWISLAGTAAAAILIIAVLLVSHPARPVTANAIEDINGDGVVDIRDALLLQQQIDRGNAKEHDVNHDGVVDHNDVDAIAQRAVRLDGGAVR